MPNSVTGEWVDGRPGEAEKLAARYKLYYVPHLWPPQPEQARQWSELYFSKRPISISGFSEEETWQLMKQGTGIEIPSFRRQLKAIDRSPRSRQSSCPLAGAMATSNKATAAETMALEKLSLGNVSAARRKGASK